MTHSHFQSDPMDFEQELKRVASGYTKQGYLVVVHPGSDELPLFAKDFQVEILANRGGEGVIVAVKKDRERVAADANMPRYAEATAAQKSWRFDLVVLEGENPMGRQPADAHDFSPADIGNVLGEADRLVRAGFVRAALISGWAGFEAAMRMRLRASGEQAGWGTMPRAMANELYSSGLLSPAEFHEIQRISRLRNEIVHGFSSVPPDPKEIQLLIDVTRRLVEESQPHAKIA